MKKLFLLVAICAPFMLFTQCKESKSTSEFTLDIAASGNPIKAYLTYMKDGEHIVDSVDVVNNKAQFKGTAEEPFAALVALSHTPEAGYSPRGMTDYKQIYIEPGKITITTENLMQNATITGSTANADAEKYAELVKPIDDEIKANISWFHGLDPKEQEENRQKAIDTDDELLEKKKNIAETFVNEHLDSWFALKMLFNEVAPQDDANAMQALFDRFAPSLKETKTAIAIQSKIDAVKATSIGEMAPDFTQNDANGNPVSLSEFRGQWVLVDFWASWCSPCRAENPHVLAAYELFKDKNFTVLGVSLDESREAWLKAIEDDNLTWTQVSNLSGGNNEASKLYAVTSIPSNFLINPEGVIVEKNLHGDALKEALEKHIGA